VPPPQDPGSALPRAAADPLAVPRSARLVAWGNAVLAGAASLDEAADEVVGGDDLHRVRPADDVPVGLAGLDDGEVGLTLALGTLRAAGATGLRLVLPAPGDAAGLPGPPAFNAPAVLAGEAVLTAGGARHVGLVPEVQALGSSGTAVRWDAYAVHAPRVGDLPALAEAERELSGAVRAATELLSRLDVARWDPGALQEVARVREGAGDGLAPGYPARAHRVMSQARLVLAIAALARRSPGGAVTAAETSARLAALAPLDRAGRRAVAAACNAVLEPARD
jgi:hypothetical protein